jgi:hypothetical protein
MLGIFGRKDRLFSRELGPDRLCNLMPAVIVCFNRLTVAGKLIPDSANDLLNGSTRRPTRDFRKWSTVSATCVKRMPIHQQGDGPLRHVPRYRCEIFDCGLSR